MKKLGVIPACDLKTLKKVDFGYPRKVGMLVVAKLQGTFKVPCNCPTLRG